MDHHFTIKDLGSAKYFLGVELARTPKGITLCQRKYISDILKDACLLDCKPAATPLPHGLHLRKNDGTPLEHPDRYKRLIGRLLYLSMMRPDVTYAVQQLSQFVTSLFSHH